ncbi:SIR2 family protein [Sinomonas terrae]|uniref:SIR2 family protein n=1 Tax=Sinomonas terrae TaxID=2908838 RepID=A0ABS9U6U9_9MICC|nr:SIR2 family protein [Sinomonas terrae]MCH6472415.1 SIR2 family protein [Sinomonas terrae]
MPLTERDEDYLLSLAFSLHNNPGAYALLLGAGISMPEVPSAWGILTELVAKQAEASGDTPADALQWYRDRHNGADPTYETFLEEMAQTQEERQRMLLRYFEPTTGDGPQPTETHRAIARLVAAGSVRVILTLNFDKLLERALLDEGITPTVVETPHKLGKRLPPLHTVRCCVVHVHGDYLSPMSMLNTEKELGQGYHRKLTKFLRQVLENYGLVIAGWSSTYDPVLRDLIRDEYSGRYTPTWIEPNDPSEQATNLIGLLNGRLVRANGEDAIGRLADAVEAMQAAKRTQHPLSVTTAAETAKRELAGERVSISLHDTFHTQLERLAKRPEFTIPEDPQAATEALQALGDVAGATRSATEACAVPAALAACIGRWGGGETVRWLSDAIIRFSQPLSPAMNQEIASLSLIASEILLYAGGVAATAGARWDDVVKLLALRSPQCQRP